MQNLLEWLQQIYLDDFCNGSWEHIHGVTVDTLDPGWDFKFDLRDTDLEDVDFEEVFIRKDEKDWHQCWKKDGVFHGWGGPKNLTNILEVFYEWYTKTSQVLEENKKTLI